MNEATWATEGAIVGPSDDWHCELPRRHAPHVDIGLLEAGGQASYSSALTDLDIRLANTVLKTLPPLGEMYYHHAGTGAQAAKTSPGRIRVLICDASLLHNGWPCSIARRSTCC